MATTDGFEAVSSVAGSGIMAGYYVLLLICISLIVLRAYVAFRLTKTWDGSDWALLASLAFWIFCGVMITIMARLGLGKHLKDLDQPELRALQILRWNSAFQIGNIWTTLCTKVSISLYILRIKSNRGLKIILFGMIALMLAATLTTTIVVLISCIPLEALWNPTIKGNCLPLSTVYTTSYAQSGVAIVTDLALTISPIYILWNVQIRLKRKLLICALMSLGLIATVANAVRNALIPELTESDFTYAITAITTVAIIEPSAGIIGACIPSVMPMYTHLRSKRLGSEGPPGTPSYGLSKRKTPLKPKSVSMRDTTGWEEVHSFSELTPDEQRLNSTMYSSAATA